MHPDAIANFTNRLVHVASLVEHRSPLDVDYYADTFFSSHGFSSVHVFGPAAWEEYRKLILSLFKQRNWSARFSEQYVRTAITGILRDSFAGWCQ